MGDWFWGSNVAAWGRIKAALAAQGFETPAGGDLDATTIKLLNTMPATDLIEILTGARVQHHKDIVKRDPSQEVFLQGWQRRTEERRVQATAVEAASSGGGAVPVVPGAFKPGTLEHRVTLNSRYQAALAASDLSTAARLLNGFNRADILRRLAVLDESTIARLHRAASSAAGVGPKSQVARLTRSPGAPPE